MSDVIPIRIVTVLICCLLCVLICDVNYFEYLLPHITSTTSPTLTVVTNEGNLSKHSHSNRRLDQGYQNESRVHMSNIEKIQFHCPALNTTVDQVVTQPTTRLRMY